MPCKITENATFLTDRVHQPLATERVVPLYQMCGRVAYLRVAFLPHIAKVCEKFVNFEWIFLYKPWIYILIIIDCFYIYICTEADPLCACCMSF